MCGAPLTISALELMLTILNENGEIHVVNVNKGSANLLELGASLAARLERGVASLNLRSEWQSLQEKFEGYSIYLHAIWTLPSTMPTKRTWLISGANDQMEQEYFRVLLEEAGNFLCRADWTVRSFPGLSEPDPVCRWLNFICEIQGDLLQTTQWGTVKGVKFDSGHVVDLARICSLVCAKLATSAIGHVAQASQTT